MNVNFIFITNFWLNEFQTENSLFNVFVFPFIRRIPEDGGPSPVVLANEKYNMLSSFLVHVYFVVIV